MISTSPLRYPGGKTRFIYIISDVLELIIPRPTVFVEPFCGGAGISLALLEKDLVPRIALNDLDELVASFWQVVFGPYPFASKDGSWADFTGRKVELARYSSLLERACDLIRHFELDLYSDAIVPVALAHRHASISLEPGKKVLDVMAYVGLRQ